MQFGKLQFQLGAEHPELAAETTGQAIKELSLAEAYIAAIDGSLADTAAFCEHYDIGLDASANCVIVEARRADKTWYAACMILATDKIDVNGAVRRHLDARKISFAPMETATGLTGMQYGGITPIGLPADWPILIDSRVDATKQIVIGSGIRGSKILVPGHLLATLPNACILDIAK